MGLNQKQLVPAAIFLCFCPKGSCLGQDASKLLGTSKEDPAEIQPLFSLEGEAFELEFERLAKHLTYLDTQGICQGRDTSSNRTIPLDELKVHGDTIHCLAQYSSLRILSIESVIERVAPILNHEDPKVRTLAMVSLYRLKNPQVVDLLVPLLRDRELTFPTLTGTTLSAPVELARRTPAVPQSVGYVAKLMLGSMLASSWGRFPIDAHPERTLEEYWSTRKNRDHWLGWFCFQVSQASGGVSPLSEDARQRIALIGSHILRLPPVEREIYYLGIFANPDFPTNLRRDDELLLCARRLGPDRLMALLRKEPIIDDPDLPLAFFRIHRFVFENAEELLGPKYADDVLKIAPNSLRPDGYIAAAKLDPSNASKILHDVFDSKQGKYDGDWRASLMIGLWQIVGEPESKFILDWFFSDRTPDMGRAPHRADLIDFLVKRFNADDRKLLSTLIRDKRFDSLDLPTHIRLVDGLNKNVLYPIVDIESRNISAPLGVYHFDGMIERARREYPEQTKQLRGVLKQWREELRKSIPSWETR